MTIKSEKVFISRKSRKHLAIITLLVIVMGTVIICWNVITSGTVSTKSVVEVKREKSLAAIAELKGDEQIVISDVGKYAFEPLVVQAGIPVKWYLEADPGEINGCNDTIIIPELGIKQGLIEGRTLVEFTPSESGDITFSCWMEMINSNIRVVDDLSDL